MASRWITDRKIKLGFALAFTLLSAMPLVVYWNREAITESNRWVAHTYEVIATLEATMRSLCDAETIERGYVITGREGYVASEEATCFAAKNLLAKLQRLTEDNPSQQRRLMKLKPVLLAKIDFMQQVIAARRSGGFDAAATLISTDKGKRLMDEIRGYITEMRREEESLLATRSDRVATSVSDGTRIVLTVMALNFGTLIFALFLVNRYMTHRREAEAKLKEAAESANTANTAKSAFLANMSHEIRTPMTAIVGYADLLLDPQQTQSDKLDNLQTIRRNARHLLELINDILDLSKIEAGKMKVEQIRCDLPQVISDVVSLMRPRALEKGLEFKLKFNSPLPAKVTTDPLRLRQVLVNLIGNAVKFTEKGRVELGVSCGASPDRQATLSFEVSDTGIGITRDQLGKLFQPFNQADETMTRRFGGSGLGLSISHRLTRLLGGTISATSEQGQGSTFTVRIDAGTIDPKEMIAVPDESILSTVARAPAPTGIRLSGRLLLAEDGRDNQRLITTHLRNAGAEVTIAENGRIAVDLATTQPFDMVLMDMQMPEMDGYAATSELRRRGMTLPIVALTAHAMAEDRGKCLAAGCTDYLTKPVEKELLLATVRSYINPPAKARPTLRSAFADDKDMSEVLAEFIAGLPDQVKQIEQLLSDSNAVALKRAVHQLKGAGGGYGFPGVTELAASAEKQIIEGQSVAAVEKQVRELIDVIRSIEGYADGRPVAKAGVAAGVAAGVEKVTVQ